ncbi:MAG: dihydrofolate reductase family protein [Longicatena sp.]
MSKLSKMEYPFDKMKLKKLYKNEEYEFSEVGIKNENLKKVYGEDLMFPKFSEDKPYMYSSLVTSIDGRIAFNDAPEGPFIASKNFLAKEGSTVDWYTLNVLRASADAIVFGANTLAAEPTGTGHVYEETLEESRMQANQNDVPWNIIPTIDGEDVPFNHIQFTCGEIPIIFYTTPKGLELCKSNAKKEVKVIDAIEQCIIPLDKNFVYIIVTGKDVMDNKLGMKMLKQLGINKLLVESPTLMHIFIQDELMDELFLNYSCVYLGGDSLTIGKRFKAFDSKNHPHTALLSVFMHSSHYMYLRHKLIYGIK